MSPGSLLDIKYSGSPVSNIYRATDSNGQYRWRIDQNFDMFLTNTSSVDLVKIGQGTSWFNSDYVGIGTTSPTTKLHMSGDNVEFRLTGGTHNSVRIFDGGTGDPGYVQTLYNGSVDSQIGANGTYFGISGFNIGIGTTSPSEKLEVFNSATTPGVLSLKSNRNDYAHVDVGRISAKQNTVEVARIGLPRAGGTNTGFLTFWTKADNSVSLSEKARIDENGNLGIGTVSPGYKLDVNGEGNFAGVLHINKHGTTNVRGSYVQLNSDKIQSSSFVEFNDSNGTKYTIGSGTESNGFFSITNSDANTELLRINSNANAYLYGTLESKKVKVSQSPGNWPDFVFAPNYELRTLNELEQFVTENKHLPEVPSAIEVEKEGLDLGKMDATLLKKVEELTLYLIDMDKKVKEQGKG